MVHVGTVTELGSELITLACKNIEDRPSRFPYRIFLIILLRVHIQACGTTGCHSLIPIFSRKELVLLLAIVNTLDDFRSNERAFCDDAFERYHAIEVGRTERSGVASVFAKGANECAVVHL